MDERQVDGTSLMVEEEILCKVKRRARGKADPETVVIHGILLLRRSAGVSKFSDLDPFFYISVFLPTTPTPRLSPYFP